MRSSDINRRAQIKAIVIAATAHAFNKGHSAPLYANIAKPNEPELFAKVKKGVPYVNPNNFGA